MTSLNVAAYGQGMMYPPSLAPNMATIQTAGWTSIILGLFHIDNVGDLSFNDTVIITAGSYVGDPEWPGQLAQLLSGQGSTITTLLASFGGWGVGDFTNILNIYTANGNSFQGTQLQTNFQVLQQTFPASRSSRWMLKTLTTKRRLWHFARCWCRSALVLYSVLIPCSHSG
jgi:hypothetical protein